MYTLFGNSIIILWSTYLDQEILHMQKKQQQSIE